MSAVPIARGGQVDRAGDHGETDGERGDERQLTDAQRADPRDLAGQQLPGPDRREQHLDHPRGLLLDHPGGHPHPVAEQLPVREQHADERDAGVRVALGSTGSRVRTWIAGWFNTSSIVEAGTLASASAAWMRSRTMASWTIWASCGGTEVRPSRSSPWTSAASISPSRSACSAAAASSKGTVVTSTPRRSPRLRGRRHRRRRCPRTRRCPAGTRAHRHLYRRAAR